MKPIRPVLTLFLAAGLTLASARAQDVRPADRNAALQYVTIFYTADRDLLTKTGEVDMAKVGFDAETMPADFKAAAEALKSDTTATVGRLIEATRLAKCDFELAWEQGINLLLPHLGKMRTGARLLRVDARRLEIAGQADEAAERLAAMIRLGRHAGNDHIMISSLVGASICNLAVEETDAALGAGNLTPTAKATILTALNSLDPDDPFAMKAAIRGEQRWTLRWVKATFHGMDAGKQLAAAGIVPTEGPEDPGVKKAVQTIEVMSESQLGAAVDLLSPFYDKVIAAWDQPDAERQLASLEERVANGEFGPIGKVFAPAAGKAYASVVKQQARIEGVKEKLAAGK